MEKVVQRYHDRRGISALDSNDDGADKPGLNHVPFVLSSSGLDHCLDVALDIGSMSIPSRGRFDGNVVDSESLRERRLFQTMPSVKEGG